MKTASATTGTPDLGELPPVDCDAELETASGRRDARSSRAAMRSSGWRDTLAWIVVAGGSRDEPEVYRRVVGRGAPVSARSMALLRLGEACDHACPMCSNSGAAGLQAWPVAELVRRVDFLATRGFRKVMLTGGEPVIHKGFWPVVQRLVAHQMGWAINTNGGSFALDGVAERARAAGLSSAIVSLHSHLERRSVVLSGITPQQHRDVLAGIGKLLDAHVDVTLNCVLARPNLGTLGAYVEHVAAHLPGASVKLTFPDHHGRGGGWDGIDLALDDVRDELREVRRVADALGITLVFESVPLCILGDAHERSVGRLAYGESHYLDDRTGTRLYSMARQEAAAAVYARGCLDCAAFERCPGVTRLYVRRRGLGELAPFGDGEAPEARVTSWSECPRRPSRP